MASSQTDQANEKKRYSKESRRFASTGGSEIPVTLCQWTCASTEVASTRCKNKFNLDYDRSQIPEIKLERTDTTLDLSL